jgi:CRP-like cAMP-binding protein
MAKISDDGFLELSGMHETPFSTGLNAEKFPILQGLTPLSLRVLNQASRAIYFSKGVEMLRVGDMSHDVYFIESGSVSIHKEIDGELKAVAKVSSGNFYGEYAAIKGKPRFTSVYAEETCKIIRVDAKAMLQVFDSDEAFKNKIYALMKERVLKTFLSTNPVFKSLNAVMRDTLVLQLSTLELARGNTLFQAGDKATNYYLVISGEAEISTGSTERSTVLEIRRANHVLGEARANQGEEYAYAVWAANSLDLLVLDKKAMQAIKQASEDVIPRLNRYLKQSAKKTAALLKNASL